MNDAGIEIGFSVRGADDVGAALEKTAKKLKKLSGAGGVSAPTSSFGASFFGGDSGINRASKSVEKAGSAAGMASRGFSLLGSAVKTAVFSVAGLGASVGASVAGLKMAFDRAAALHKQANALGEDAGRVRLLGQAFVENGLSAEQIVPMITKMQKKIAQTPEAFRQLGIDAVALQGKSAVEQMTAIGEAVRGIGSQESKMAALMKVFEEAGPQLMQLFNNPKALEDASRTLGSSVRIMSANAAAFERASTLIGNVSVKVGTFFDGVAAGVVGPLNSLLEALNGIDLAAKGEAFGNAVRDAVSVFYKAFQNDQLFELVGVKLAAVLSKAGSSLWSSMLDAGTSVSSSAFAAVEALLDSGNGKGFSRNFADAKKRNEASADRSGIMRFARGTDGIAKEWADLESKLERSLAALVSKAPWESETNQTPASKGAGVGEIEMPKMGSSGASRQVDSLARIGGTIGGSSSALTAASQQTARNTERMAASLDAISRRLSSPSSSSSMVAVYAA